MSRRRVVFDHERLEVYRKALDLVVLVDRLAPSFTGLRRHLGWQLHKAASSLPLNMAEGNGRNRPLDRARFFVMAVGSAMECTAILDIADRLQVGNSQLRLEIRSALESIIPMLIRLSRSARAQNRLDS